MQSKFINLTNDRLFKFVFLHEELAEDLLNSYFDLFNMPHHKVVKDVPHALIASNKYNGKDYYSDIFLTLDNKEKVVLEMYSSFNDEAYCKSLSYTSRLYGNQLNRKKRKKHDTYKKTKKVLCLNFISGNYRNENPEFINKQGMCNFITKKPCYIQKIQMVQVRLDKRAEMCYTDRESRFYKWVKFMCAKTMEEMEDLTEGDETMESALEYVHDFLNENATSLSIARDNLLILQGEEQGIIQTANNLLKMNMSKDIITQATGLTIEEINNLKENIEK